MVRHEATSPDGKSRRRAKRAQRRCFETLVALVSCRALLGGAKARAFSLSKVIDHRRVDDLVLAVHHRSVHVKHFASL
jgi:hypothetical protein